MTDQAMTSIVITGARSFLGQSLEKYMNQINEELSVERYRVKTLDLRDEAWKQFNFSGIHTVYHVAGIAHSSIKKNSGRELYFKVNSELAEAVAQRAKIDGVKQFIFMSSSMVYGDKARMHGNTIISEQTIPNPNTIYGKSKLEAEKRILKLKSKEFKVVIIRSPMIYGEGCKGNYLLLRKVALITPIFPVVNNKRSMIYVGNLMEFVRLLIEDNAEGIYWPQNDTYIDTSEMVRLIANANNRNIRFLEGYSLVINILCKINKTANKAFGTMIYEKKMSIYEKVYNKYSFPESIKRTEFYFASN